MRRKLRLPPQSFMETPFSRMHSSAVKNAERSRQPSADNVLRDVLSLPEKQRAFILRKLQEDYARDTMEEYTNRLGRLSWRSRFGRPAANLAADPTGQFCEVPTSYIEQKLAEKEEKPTNKELWDIGLFNAVPFIGFGFLDNLVMIIAGDYIDLTIGITFGISTMAAAALGNTVSDIAGIGSAWYVESIASKVGVKSPNCTPTQLEMPSARWVANIGRAVGVIIGCILGMFPLMFIETKEKAAAAADSQPSPPSTEKE